MSLGTRAAVRGERRWVRYLALLGILALAAGLRLTALDRLPPGLYHDEAYNGLDALSLARGELFPRFYEGWELYAQDAHAGRPATTTRWPPFFEGNYGREPLHIYLMALSIKFLGATPLAVRLVPAVAGVLAVLTTYLAASALFEEEPAVPLLAAFALAVLYPALTFSRFGVRAMLFVPLETAAVACFWRGAKRGGRGWFAAAGLVLGLGVYSYAAARLLPLLFLLVIPLWFWADRPAARRHWRGVLVMAIISLLVAAPLLLYFARYPYFFLFRMGYVANKGLGAVPGKPWLTWIGNLGRVVSGLFWHGEENLRHNLPGRPYLDPLQAGLFCLGVLAGVRAGRIGRRRRLFILIWLGVMLLPTLLSGDAPHFGRMTGAAPVIAILIGVGGLRLWTWGRARAGERGVSAGLALILLTSAGLTGWDYFSRYAGHPDLPAAFQEVDWELGQYAASQPADALLYMTPTQEEMATIYFALEGDPDRLRSYSSPAGLLPLGEAGHAAVYFVRPVAQLSLDALVEVFPTGTVDKRQDEFTIFVAPAAASRFPADNLVDVALDGTIRLRGWSVDRYGDQLTVVLVWEALHGMDRDYTAFVHLLDNTGVLVAQLDRQPAGYPTGDWRAREIVMDAFQVQVPSDQASGVYALRTGFYFLPTMAPLGESVLLGDIPWSADQETPR